MTRRRVLPGAVGAVPPHRRPRLRLRGRSCPAPAREPRRPPERAAERRPGRCPAGGGVPSTPDEFDGGAPLRALSAEPATVVARRPLRCAASDRPQRTTSPSPRCRVARPGSGRPAGSRPRGADRRPSGREKHDEKITVYISAEELIELERARLALRGDHGVAVDRGRIVREAVAVVLADLDAKGEGSILVRRLRES